MCITEAYQVGAHQEQLANNITPLPTASAALHNFFFIVLFLQLIACQYVSAVFSFGLCKTIKMYVNIFTNKLNVIMSIIFWNK